VNVLTKIYWIRVALGAIAGAISTGISVAAQQLTGTTIISQITNTNTLLNGITIALLVYLISFYVLKAKYAAQLEKKSKIMSMGIFIYFFSWLIVWVLTLTVIIGPV
jgi:hypothetical protein